MYLSLGDWSEYWNRFFNHSNTEDLLYALCIDDLSFFFYLLFFPLILWAALDNLLLIKPIRILDGQTSLSWYIMVILIMLLPNLPHPVCSHWFWD